MILVLVIFVLELLPKPKSDYELIDGDEHVIIHFVDFQLFYVILIDIYL